MDTKRQIRHLFSERRAARTPEAVTAARDAMTRVGTMVPLIRRARCVALYVSVKNEPPTGGLRSALHRAGVRVILPVITDPTGESGLDWAEDDGAADPGSLLGIPEPSGPRQGPDALAEADVLIVPALAVDADGTRLGKGRGFYDRALTRRRPGAAVFALVYADELLDAGSIPAEPHDVPVDGMITDDGWRFSAVAGSGSGRRLRRRPGD